MNIMPFNSDLNKQALGVLFPRTLTKSYHLQTCFNDIFGIYLNAKLNFYYHILVRNVQISARFRKLCLFYYIQD